MSIRKRCPTHPGVILKTYYLEPRKISVSAFAEATGLTRKHISYIVNGRAGVTAETAVRFAGVLGTSPEYWLNLQTAYDLYQAIRAVGKSRKRAIHKGAFASANS
ncbi:MAG: HigA family addiction module antitoxin [Pseudomonadota bacterium]